MPLVATMDWRLGWATRCAHGRGRCPSATADGVCSWALVAVLVVAFVARIVAALVGWDFRHGSDADMYERLAAQLYHDGEFGIPGSAEPVRLRARRAALRGGGLQPDRRGQPARRAHRPGACAGRSACSSSSCSAAGSAARGPGSSAAALAAVYPPTLFYTLAAVAASRWRCSPSPAPCSRSCGRPTTDRRRGRGRCPALLLGLTAFLRPEYLVLTALLALLAVVVVGSARGPAARGRRRRPDGARLRGRARAVDDRPPRTSSAASCPSAPAAARRSSSAPTCPATACTSASSSTCYHRFARRRPADRSSCARMPMNPLLDAVAEQLPDLPRDEALGRIGRRTSCTRRPASRARSRR